MSGERPDPELRGESRRLVDAYHVVAHRCGKLETLAECDAARLALESYIGGLESRVRELEARPASEELRQLRNDAMRWQYVKPGLFVTPYPRDPNYPGQVQIVYQSGTMDEYAQEMYERLPKNSRGLVFDVTPIIDERIRKNDAPEES